MRSEFQKAKSDLRVAPTYNWSPSAEPVKTACKHGRGECTEMYCANCLVTRDWTKAADEAPCEVSPPAPPKPSPSA